MVIKVKKTKQSPKGDITLEELSEELAINNVNQKIDTLDKKIKEQVKKISEAKLTRVKLINLLSLKSGIKLPLLNVTFNRSIEKNQSIATGVIYYDPKAEELRCKTKSGWKTCKME